MQITIINDCCDQNAKMRQVSRIGSLFRNCSVSCFGVKSKLEASGFLLDAIDAFEGREGVIIANFARREGKPKKGKNGVPFGFFWHRKTLIVSSADDIVLSLVKKLNVIKELRILDISDVLRSVSNSKLSGKTKYRIVSSQFRSFDFLPRAACWLTGNKNVPYKKYDLSKIADAPKAVWFVDNFGNVKTTLLKKELYPADGGIIRARVGGKVRRFNFYNRLVDLPDKSTGLILGSSGIEGKRLVEIITKGRSAARKLNIEAGSEIEIIKN